MTFWNLVNKLDKTNASSELGDNISHKEFVHFFQNLNRVDNNNRSFHDDIVHKFGNRP